MAYGGDNLFRNVPILTDKELKKEGKYDEYSY